MSNDAERVVPAEVGEGDVINVEGQLSRKMNFQGVHCTLNDCMQGSGMIHHPPHKSPSEETGDVIHVGS